MSIPKVFIALLLLPVLEPVGSLWGQSSAGTAHWVGSWACSQQVPEPQNVLPVEYQQNVTLRQIVHLSIGGSRLRIHLSNAFGTTPLHLTSVHIARPAETASSRIVASSDKELSFSGRSDVTIPAGAEYISDAVEYPAAALSDLAITLHLDTLRAQETGHPGSHATSYLAFGDVVAAADLPSAKAVEHWYAIAGVDVDAAAGGFAVVALGDSITDGHGSTTNGNNRWPDELAQRLQASAAMRSVGVLNQGIGGNHLLTDGLGPNVLARFDRDVLAQPGVRVVILLEGINDLGGLARAGEVSATQHEELVRRMIGAYEQVVLRAHAHGIRVIGGTILPDMGSDYYHPAAANEADRLAINRWIRAAGNFDAVVDFDKVMGDPAKPGQMLPAYDSGDHLHPSPAGYRVMAEAIPTALLLQ